MSASRVVDLDALANPARQAGVKIGDVVYPVTPLGASVALRIAVAYEGDSSAAIIEAMTAAARASVATMPDAVFAGLSVEAVSAIVGIARDGADAVEAMLAERAKAEGAAGN